MPVLSKAALRLLGLVLAEAFLRGLTPSGWRHRWDLFSAEFVRFPPVVLLAASFLPLILLALVPLFRPSSRLAFVLGVGAIGSGTLIMAKATHFGLYLVGEGLNYFGVCLFAASAFALEAERFPRRWLLLGPVAYFAVHALGGWLQPILLPSVGLFTERSLLIGWLMIALAVLSGLVFAHEMKAATNLEGEEHARTSPTARRGLFALLGLVAVAVPYLRIPVPEAYNLYLGQYGSLDGPKIAGVVLGQVLPFALIVFLLVRGIGLGSAIRTMSVTLVVLTAIGWLLPWLRSYILVSAQPLLILNTGVIAIASARSSPQHPLRTVIRVQIVFGVCNLLISQALTGIAGIRWSQEWPPRTALPLGASLSLAMVVIAILISLYQPELLTRPTKSEPLSRPAP